MDESERIKIINDQISLIKEGVEIIKSRVTEIETKGKGEKSETELDDVARALIVFTKREYIDHFSKIASFLCEKLPIEKNENFIFYIPNLRVLIEIYAHILHLSFEDKEKQTSLILFKNFSTLRPKGGESQSVMHGMHQEYLKSHKYYQPLMDAWSIEIPENPDNLSNTYLSKRKLDYPSIKEMLNKERICLASPQTSKFFPMDKRNPYLIYSHFSNYSHPNTFHKESFGRENFWIISELLLLTALVVELIDLKIIEKRDRKDLRLLLKKLGGSRAAFLKTWLASPRTRGGVSTQVT